VILHLKEDAKEYLDNWNEMGMDWERWMVKPSCL